jgi:hypothetical protein
MAIFKAPRINSEQRSSLVLQEAEVVYDVDLKQYFGGDGILEGGFPLGKGTEPYIQLITITNINISDKQIVLEKTVTNPSKTRLEFLNGTLQIYEIDYTISDGNKVVWESLGLDGFIEENDVIRVEYW